MKKITRLLDKFVSWQAEVLSDNQRVIILSVLVGFFVGLAAVTIKNLVHVIHVVAELIIHSKYPWLYIVLPIVGISITVAFVKYINRRPVRHGIPGVLYAISKNRGHMNRHNVYSSVLTSAFTVGFGGSVGLEGPTVATGAAIGSQIGQFLKLNYKQITLLLGCACAGAMASIFKAPIAAVVFALEVIMLDLTMAAIVPLLISSATAAITGYLFWGQSALYGSFILEDTFKIGDIWHYILFAIFAGTVAAYFSKVYMFITGLFERFNRPWWQVLIGGSLLGLLVFFIPSLYGEGYEEVNMGLQGNLEFLFHNTPYSSAEVSVFSVLILLLVILTLKVVATALTFGAGGVGGIFAPTLFTGVIAGLFYSYVMQLFGVYLPVSNFALVGMSGLIAAVIHAPLTSIFLIAELTGGYELFVPLMLVSTISYATTKIFVPNSVYTTLLAKRGELITHHKDKAVLLLMRLDDLIETDFNTLKPNQKLGDLIETIKFAHRNVFPVVEENGTFRGIVKLDDIRHIMFNSEMYNNIYVRDLMFMPDNIIFKHESVEEVAKKFQQSKRYNIVVIDRAKYVGVISRAKLFSTYRELLEGFSEH